MGTAYKQEFLYDPLVPLVGIQYKVQNITLYVYVYKYAIAALFKIAKIWKQHKCSTTDEKIMQWWHIVTQWNTAYLRKNVKSSFILQLG